MDGRIFPNVDGLRDCHANDFIDREAMRRAAAHGSRLFDFARSRTGTGALAAAIPDHNPLNPKYRRFITAWKKLPLPVANALGPPIVRGLG